jgi:hypothetical protein
MRRSVSSTTATEGLPSGSTHASDVFFPELRTRKPLTAGLSTLWACAKTPLLL